jgi:hypothetical protein
MGAVRSRCRKYPSAEQSEGRPEGPRWTYQAARWYSSLVTSLVVSDLAQLHDLGFIRIQRPKLQSAGKHLDKHHSDILGELRTLLADVKPQKGKSPEVAA